MNLEEILQKTEFALPASNNSGKPFVLFVEQKLNEYLAIVKASAGQLFDGMNYKILSPAEFINELEYYCNSLLNVIRLQNANKIDEASLEFRNLMGSASPFIANHQGATHYIDSTDIFYRCKFYGDPALLKPKEYFFHAPFQSSHLVPSTRFSSNGFPSMYLTNTMIVGYHEVRATSLVNFQGVKIQAIRPQTFLNLDYNVPSISLKATDQNLFFKLLQIKGLIYPFHVCCYSQHNLIGPAPNEYIVPQLLARWVQANSSIYSGIRYPSTRIDNPNYQGTFYNLIVYPRKVADEGYCEILKKSYLMSDVCSACVHQAEINAYYAAEFPRIMEINKDIFTVDWAGAAQDYNINDIGKIEFFMRNKLTSEKILF